MNHNNGAEKIIYTCPMHPEVRKTKPGKCPGCGMDLIPEKKSAGSHADHDMQNSCRRKQTLSGEVSIYLLYKDKNYE